MVPLTAGARVVLASRDEAADGARLLRQLTESGATILQATPVTWQLLLAAGWPGSAGLTALCGGEALPRGLANELCGRTAVLWNMYGPTETTVWSTMYRVSLGAGPVPIGRPIANTRLYVLDPQLQPAPANEPGELYIGGAGLARGYLNRPDLTAERFIPNPFADEPGSRLYKTGDLARYLPDGSLEFLGRADHQVKIRGFRIELAEIEALLSQHPAVRQAVVLVKSPADDPAGRRLVAYVVPRPAYGEPAGETGPAVYYNEGLGLELRDYLEEKLPGYMVPALYLFLAAFPLTPNGKVDRQALPGPDLARPVSTPYLAPRNSLEAELAAIWAGVLGLERVGVTDNFFELGGHSLLAARIIARLRDKFQLELPLSKLFEAATVAGLAGYLAGLPQAAPGFAPAGEREEGEL